MYFEVLTLFPEIFTTPLSCTVLGRAIGKGVIQVKTRDLRPYGIGSHRQIDDEPYGGGAGMVMKPEPLVKALEDSQAEQPHLKKIKIYLSPQGKKLEQSHLARYLEYDQITLLCGRYEGIDERVLHFIDEEVSIGDYILTGGEFPALVFIDALSRLIPGVVGKEESVRHDTFSQNLLDFPQYTRPPDFKGMKVPEVLLSGDHKKISRWREEQALLNTQKKRPDLLIKG